MMVLLLVTLHRGSLLDSFIYLLFHYDEANRNRIMRIDNMDTKLIALKEFVNLKEKGKCISEIYVIMNNNEAGNKN